MLREATHCGLLLDPEGIASQAAISFTIPPPSPSYPTPHLSSDAMTALTRLRTLVESQSHNSKLESEQEDEVEQLRKSLSQDVLVKIVEAAAEYDISSKEMSKDALAGMNESLVGGWVVVEMLVFKTRQYTKEGMKEEDEIK
jgi:hypothetical protein